MLNIRAPSRRIVTKEKRKRALFSCDRCKAKKIACQRENNNKIDSRVSCKACKKSNINCQTSINRKKESTPMENIGLHYKCMVSLLSNLFPDKNVKNIDVLIELGKDLNINMPSREGLEENEVQDLKEIAQALTSSRRRIKNSFNTTPHVNLKDSITHSQQSVSDIHYIDMGGNRHYIGPFGAPSFLMMVADNITSIKNTINGSAIEDCKKLFRLNHPISSVGESADNDFFLDLFLNPFLVSKSLADGYVDIFFKEIHPFCYCIVEHSFMKNYIEFWDTINVPNSGRVRLEKSKICLIYLVWILGERLSRFNDDETFSKNCFTAIDYFIPEMLVSPSLDSIRCMMLLSMYFDYFSRRESGYILLEVAICQARSMGLHRISSKEYIKDEITLEESKRTWWTLFSQTLKFNSQMGRYPGLSINEITLDIPISDDFEPSSFQRCWIESIYLSKECYSIMSFRRSLSSIEDVLSDENIKKAISIRERIFSWLKALPYASKEDLNKFESHLMMTYHYYILSLTFPFLLVLVKNQYQINDINGGLLGLLKLSISSSNSIKYLVRLRKEKGYSNGVFSPDTFFIYHSVLCLISFYTWLNSSKLTNEYIQPNNLPELLDMGINISEIHDELIQIKKFNSQYHKSLKGTSLTLSTIITSLLDTVLGKLTSDEKNVPYEFNEYNKPNTMNFSSIFNDDLLYQLNLSCDYIFS